jgi:hypothetical protein
MDEMGVQHNDNNGKSHAILITTAKSKDVFQVNRLLEDKHIMDRLLPYEHDYNPIQLAWATIICNVTQSHKYKKTTGTCNAHWALSTHPLTEPYFATMFTF